MKKRMLLFCLLILTTFVLCGCGEEPIDPVYSSTTVTLQSFTEIAGENPDNKEKADGAYIYTYEISDGQVGAAAFNLYKDYLDENFTYSMIDSTVSDDGVYTMIYADENDAEIIYTEAVDNDGAYTITVRFPQ
jgi:predicted component of type VI protein secretion system